MINSTVQYISFSVLLWALISSCGNKPKGTPSVTGTIEGAAGQTIYLEMLQPQKVTILDSAKIDADGNFVIYKKAREKNFYQLRVGNQKPNNTIAPNSNIMVVITDSTETLKITATYPTCSATYVVEGSEETNLLKEINTIIIANQARLDSLNKAYQQNPQTFDQVKATELMNSIMAQQSATMKQFVEKHVGKFVTLQAIAMLNPDTDLNLFKKTSELLSEKYPNNPFVLNFSSSVASMTKLAPGTIAPNFTISTPDDKPISLNDFKGKYVLIDFWASWCRPCRAQNPELVALYKKFKGKNFEIFGVSLDQNKDAWVQAIAADKLTWPQGSDLQYWNAAPAKLYNITFIPFNYLIGPDGTILAKNLTGKDLENKLQELLNSKPL